MLVANIVWPCQCSRLSQLVELTKRNFYGRHAPPSFALSAHCRWITNLQGNDWSHVTSCAVWQSFCINVLEMHVGIWRCVVYHITLHSVITILWKSFFLISCWCFYIRFRGLDFQAVCILVACWHRVHVSDSVHVMNILYILDLLMAQSNCGI